MSPRSEARHDSPVARDYESRAGDFGEVADTLNADSHGEWVLPVPEDVRIRGGLPVSACGVPAHPLLVESSTEEPLGGLRLETQEV